MTLKVQTLGILGGGQLGRMSALAAARLGIKTHIYAPEGDCPAAQACAAFTHGAYEDVGRLKTFANACDVISYEFENIPVETIRFLKKFKPVYPDDTLLDISQNRLKEKQFLNDINIPTTRWMPAKSVDDVIKAAQTLDLKNFIIKTARFGYDGKGQVYHRDGQDILDSWSKLYTQDAIMEEVVDFSCEISVVVGRNTTGDIVPYPPVMNTHEGGILRKTLFPAPIDDTIAARATDMAVHLAEQVNLVGILALEMFVTRGGDLLANEIAPRTHNSGHWTIDACAVSQFEQHVRAVCGFPLGAPAPHNAAEMINLIGDDMTRVAEYLALENACVHLYGKQDVKPGRKMGHVTLLKELA